MSTFFQDLINAAAGYYTTDQAAKGALRYGEEAAQAAEQLGEEAASMTQFKPFTVTTGLGTAKATDEGGYALTMSPEQEALQKSLLTQAQGLFGKVGTDPSVAQADLYNQMRAIQRPEEERNRLALEERMLSQGRLGLQSSAYGGSSPELLAQETARQEAMARANLGARTQAMSEQAQALTAATGLLGAGYMPQEQALGALGYGIDLAKIPAAGRQTGAELFGQLGGRGLESLMQGLELATGLESSKRSSLTDTLLGRQPTLQEQLLGSALGVDVSSDGGLFSSLGFGEAETPSYIKAIGDILGFGSGKTDQQREIEETEKALEAMFG